ATPARGWRTAPSWRRSRSGGASSCRSRTGRGSCGGSPRRSPGRRPGCARAPRARGGSRGGTAVAGPPAPASRRAGSRLARVHADAVARDPFRGYVPSPREHVTVATMALEPRRMVRGALAGGVAAAAWALLQPLDKRALRCDYDDVELLGRALA